MEKRLEVTKAFIEEIEKAAQAAALATPYRWHYDDGITNTDGEHGKIPVLETYTQKLGHVILFDPYDMLGTSEMDACCRHVKTSDPHAVIALINHIKTLEAALNIEHKE